MKTTTLSLSENKKSSINPPTNPSFSYMKWAIAGFSLHELVNIILLQGSPWLPFSRNWLDVVWL